MDVLRLIHFADLHLGVETGGKPNPASGLNQRVHDVLDRLDEVCACVEDEDVHAVLFAGDAFKNQHPTPTLQALFAERIRRIAKAGAGVFLLVGNHDLPKMAALSHPFSIYDALEVEGVVVGDRARVYEIPLPPGAPAPVLQVAALPHFSRHQVRAKMPDATDEQIEQVVADTIKKLTRDVQADLPAVFCGHCHVNQAEIGSAQALFGISELEVSLSTLTADGAFPYYALGHVHHRQVLSRDPWVGYSGSLERVDFGEGEKAKVAPHPGATADRAAYTVDRKAATQKGFYRVDLSPDGWRLHDEPSFRPTNARGFVTVRMPDVASDDPTADVLARIARACNGDVPFADALVKLVVEIDAADRPRLETKSIAGAVPGAYDVRVVCEVAPESHAVRDPRFATRMSEVQALEHYVAGREDWASDRDAILAAGRELISEVLG